MSDRQTRNAFRSRLDTPGPSRGIQRSEVGSDEGSSTSGDESGGEAWNSKTDGAVIQQSHYGGKRRRTGRARGVKRERVDTGKKSRRKRVKSESIDINPEEAMGDKATQQEEEEMNGTINEADDQGNQAELEEDTKIQEEEVTTRRSGRATKTPSRFDEVRFQPYGAPVVPANQVNITQALGKLKESRAPSSRREISTDGSPDPIASFSDDHDMAIDPVDEGPMNEITKSTDLPNPPVNDERPIKPKIAKPRKSALKPKHPTGPRRKRGKVTIDETKNSIRTIKLISSTSSDIGRHPSLPNPIKGPKRYGVRSRRTVPVMGVSLYTGKRAVQKYEYVVSSDSTESEEEDEIDPVEFREWIKSRKEQERKNGSFLLTLAARISDLPTDSSTKPPPPSTLPPRPEEPIWTKPFSLTPIRPPPPINPDHPSNQEQEKVWNMFVDCACTKWEEENDTLLRQVKVFQPAGSQGSPLAPGALGAAEPSRAGVHVASKNTAEEGDMTDLIDSRQELGMLAGSEASLPEPIPRPGFDFEKSCERLAGLEIADRAMGMRLHIPEKRSIKF